MSAASCVKMEWIGPWNTEVRVAQWFESIVLTLVRAERKAMTELRDGCPDVDLKCLVTEAYATYWSSWLEASDSKVKAGLEYVILEMMSSCCD
jgi:hypothetical protein